MNIGFFDSGIGGITVLHEAMRLMPCGDYVYYADSDNAPYGIKPKDEVTALVLSAVDFIAARGVDAVVIACNTATSVAIETLRSRYLIPVIGMEPAIKPAVEKNEKLHKRVLVTATPLTLKEEKLRNLIARVDNEHVVDLLPLPGLVKFAEDFRFDDAEVRSYLEHELSAVDVSLYGTVVLGCTHFIYFRQLLKKMLPGTIDIIDGNAGTVRNLKNILEEKKIPVNGSGAVTYYASGRLVEDRELLEKYNDLHRMLDGE